MHMRALQKCIEELKPFFFRKKHIFTMCFISWIIGPLYQCLRFGLTTYVTEDGICMYGQRWSSYFWVK